jgi:threonine aldolase
MLSITQATERGAVYTPQEVRALADIAHANHMAVHMDGARFANAVIATNATPAELTWKSGVDVLSFGIIKNGGMNAEAVVFFDPARVADFEFRRKRAGQLACKGRYAAVQLTASIESGSGVATPSAPTGWRPGLRRRTGAAQRALRHQPGVHEAGDERIAALSRELVYPWGPAGSGEARFVCSGTPPTDVDALCAALAKLR